MIISPTILIVTNLRIFFDPWNFPPTIIIIIIITSWILESKERSSTRTTVENNGNDDCGWFSQRQLSPFLSFDLRFLVFSSTLLLMHTCQYRRIYIYIYRFETRFFRNDRSIDRSIKNFYSNLKAHLAVNLIVGRVPTTEARFLER